MQSNKSEILHSFWRGDFAQVSTCYPIVTPWKSGLFRENEHELSAVDSKNNERRGPKHDDSLGDIACSCLNRCMISKITKIIDNKHNIFPNVMAISIMFSPIDEINAMVL